MRRAIARSLFLLVLIPAVGVLAVSCGSEETAYETLPYTVDESLLQTPIVIPEAGVTLAPPHNWLPMEAAKLDQFRRMLGGTELSREFYPVYPLAVLTDSASGLMMHISLIEETEQSLDAIVKKYEDFIMPRLKGQGIDKKRYLINDLPVYLYRVHSSRVVNFKLLGQSADGHCFLIEYVIGTALFAANERAVTSSIASLTGIE